VRGRGVDAGNDEATGATLRRSACAGVVRVTFDEALQSATRGDETAFAFVYRELTPRLLRYAAGLVGQDAEDVVAEAWLQIARDLRRFAGDENSFRAWTARIVRNRAMDHLRAGSRRPVVSTPLDELVTPAADDDTALAALDNLSTWAAIELIASLPPDQAEAVLLRAVVGLDPGSAGRVVGKSAGAVRVAAHRGLKNLASRMQLEGRGLQ
jgi:RNA polymerase sigma-70 factor (ECF subfamily)